MTNPVGLSFTDTRPMSLGEWLDYRRDYQGGSDIGTIGGLNPYYSKVQLFYQKLGLDKEQHGHNVFTASGTILEDTVLMIGEHYDHSSADKGNWVQNWENKTPLRKNKKFPFMVNNAEFHWLLANLDGIVNLERNWKSKMKRNQRFFGDAIAEAKTISRFNMERYVNGIPPYYILQISMYMIVCQPMLRGEPMAHLYMLEDGRNFHAFRMGLEDGIRDKILEDTYDFHLLLTEGRNIVANASSNEQMMRGLQEIEPDPDGSKIYEQFISERMQKKMEFVTVDATDEIFSMAKQYQSTQAKITDLTADKQLLTNQIKKFMDDNDANQINLKDQGKITFNKRFYVNWR